MNKFQAIQVFIKVADLGGFAVAARNLNMSPPAVTRTISMLEEQLGVRLFVRTTRSVMLTDSGRRFLEDTKRILLDLEEAEKAAVGSYAEPKGLLNITASVLFGRMYIAPILADFLDQYSQLEVRTHFVDRVVNLIDEGVDVGVRIGHLQDSSLMAVRCGVVRQVVVASPEYLAKSGDIRCPEDLGAHAIINSAALTPSASWHFDRDGQRVELNVNPRIQMNTNDAVIEMALHGCGVARVLSYQVAHHVAAGRLEAILTPFEPAPSPIHLVHQEGQMVSAKVRSFVDFAANRLKEDPHLK